MHRQIENSDASGVIELIWETALTLMLQAFAVPANNLAGGKLCLSVSTEKVAHQGLNGFFVADSERFGTQSAVFSTAPISPTFASRPPNNCHDHQFSQNTD